MQIVVWGIVVFNGDNTVVEEDYDKNFFGDYW